MDGEMVAAYLSRITKSRKLVSDFEVQTFLQCGNEHGVIDERGFIEYYAQKILPTGNIQDTSSKHFA